MSYLILFKCNGIKWPNTTNTMTNNETFIIDNKTDNILITFVIKPLYALFQVDHSLCGREWTRAKQLSDALSSHPVSPWAHIPHSGLWNHFCSPSEKAPPHAEIHKFMSIHHQHVKREDVVKTECDREQRERLKGKRREEMERKRRAGKQKDRHVAKARVKEKNLERQ